MSYINLTTLTLFNHEIVNFFTHANIGPLVTGIFKDKELPDIYSLRSTQERLNDSLIFIKPEINNQSNLHYHITNESSLTHLFILHTYYTKMQYTHDTTRLSASKEMRQYLRQTMIKVINNDCIYALTGVRPKNDEMIQEIDETRQTMIDCIDNPDDLSLKGKKYYISNTEYLEIFNPNWFLYADFPKLIAYARLEMDPVLREQEKIIKLARTYDSLHRTNK